MTSMAVLYSLMSGNKIQDGGDHCYLQGEVTLVIPQLLKSKLALILNQLSFVSLVCRH